MDINLCKYAKVNLDQLVNKAVDFAISNRLVMLKKEKKTEMHIPFTLFPTPFPAETLKYLEEIQPHFNRLYWLVAQDEEFLKTSLQNVLEIDDFMKKLFKIYKEVHPNKEEAVELGVIRADYMLKCMDPNEYIPKQVEVNTTAITWYSYVNPKLKDLYSNTLKICGLDRYIKDLGGNHITSTVANAFVSAWERYGNPKAIITFIHEDGERRIFDQHEIEYAIRKVNPKIQIKKKCFDDLIKDMVLERDNTLVIDNEEVAIAYFFCADYPEEYKTKEHWRVRLEVEKSKAVKSPSIGIQIAQSKIIQQVLAKPGVMERFVHDPEIAMKLRRTFAELYTLGKNAAGDVAVKMALANPRNYVMKHQREGGCNYFDDDMVKVLTKSQNYDQRTRCILMERIFPKPTENIIVNDGKPRITNVVTELGVYGIYLSQGGELIENYTAGHFLRSKPKESNDAIGLVTDFPLLV